MLTINTDKVRGEGKYIAILQDNFTFDDTVGLKEVNNAVSDPTVKSVILDCSDLSRVDTATIGSIVMISENGKKAAKDVRVIGAAGSVEAMLTISGVLCQ